MINMRELLDKKQVLDRLSYWAKEAEMTDDNAQYKQVRSDTFREARIVIEDEVPVINESDLLNNKVKYKKPVVLKPSEIKKIIVAIAGPLTNFLIIFITSNLQLNIIKSTLIMYTNFLIMIFNLLPIYPLDGGRILKSTLHIILGKRGAEKYINIVSKVIVIFITIASSIIILYVHNVAIVLINIYLWFLVVREDVKIKKREDIYKKILENSVV